MQIHRERRRSVEALERLTVRAEELVAEASQPLKPLSSPIPGVVLVRHLAPTSAEATLYKPIVCLILRGRKETQFAGETVRVGAGEALLVSHDVSIVARAVQAPYLALVFEIDLSVLRSLYEELGELLVGDGPASALQVNKAEEPLIEALERYLALAQRPTDARVLGAMVRREIHYRLLMAPFGTMLRKLLRHDSHASAIARAMAILRRDYRAPMEVAQLAREVGMSVSSFHKHFKQLACSSPLQYQKELRLLEAQRLLSAGTPVTSVAYDVGYESPTQFSREYARKFGRAPSKDLSAALRRAT
jgi:AraC-like DNA-binding protein